MSEYLPEHNVGPEPPRYAAQRDVGPYGKLALLLAGVLAVFAVAVFLMWRWQVASTAIRPKPPPVPPKVGEAEIAGVNQAMFELEDRARRSRRQDREWLGGYGWVDADAGIAHIPVEQAFDLVLAAEAERGRQGESGNDGGTP